MAVLVAGLLLFLGVHSLRAAAPGWRAAQVARLGDGGWKALVSLASAAGLVLIVWGYAVARQQPLPLWDAPPLWTRHAASLLMLLSFVLLAAAYVPRNAIRARLHHPMLLGVKAWALAHLLANHTLADLLLFGGFLAWAVAAFVAARRRDRAAATAYPPGRAAGTAAAVAIGAVAWLLFALWGHRWLIGVQPIG